jgi:iron complex outermembrane receptor protein
MRRFFLSTGILALVAGNIFAQEEQVADSVLLSEVAAYAPYKKYQAGAKIESVSIEQVQIAQSGGLDQLLSRFAPIYLKSNAGGLSTIRLRGTAPDHTSVNFGGININSLTLGHSDFSSVPVYLFDGFDLQYGSSSAVNGSGSIGGAIYLGLNNNWTNGSNVKATISQGSFGEQLYGTKAYWGNGKFESVTRLYYFMLKNDFPFTNPDNNKNYIQRGAMIENMGLIQELNYKFGDKEWIKSALWLEHDWHQIQLLMDEVASGNTTPETLDNKNIRFWSEYENNKHPIQYKAGLGYVKDMQLYNANQDAQIGTNRLIAELEAKQDFSVTLGYKAGARYTYIKPDVYAYDKDVIDHEQQADLYLSGFYSPWNKLKLTMNLRQQVVTRFDVPFTPSVGAEYRLYLTENSVTKATGSIARSYRVPTFNDRYWPIVGNPDLKPEDGMNYELGTQYSYCSAKFRTELKLNAFLLNVKNWIEWAPASGDWKPFNKSQVISNGFEFSSNIEVTLTLVQLNFRINYSFNPTKIKDDQNPDLIGRQVLYVPKHMGNAFLNIHYRNWGLFADGNYTGERLANYVGNIFNPNGDVLNDYFLLNCGLSRKQMVNKHLFTLILTSNNIMDKAYYNQPGYAMWGRSFRITLSTDLNFSKN